jgi:hypothetical protein
MIRRVAITAVVVAFAFLVGCAVAPEPSALSGQPVVREGRDAGFALSMRIGSDVVDSGTPIDLSAVLTWEGVQPRATIWGSGSGPVTFTLERIGGDLLLGGAMTADCSRKNFERLVPVPVPFAKSLGFSDDDPNADFYRAYIADPLLRLPAGRWRVSTTANGYLLPCEMNAPSVDIRLTADILVR